MVFLLFRVDKKKNKKKNKPIIYIYRRLIRSNAIGFVLSITVDLTLLQHFRSPFKRAGWFATWIIGRVTSWWKCEANRMFNTCAVSDSYILRDRESTHFRSREHATEISPGKNLAEVRSNVGRPTNCFIDIPSEKFLAEPPLRYRHASSFDKITALSRGGLSSIENPPSHILRSRTKNTADIYSSRELIEPSRLIGVTECLIKVTYTA